MAKIKWSITDPDEGFEGHTVQATLWAHPWLLKSIWSIGPGVSPRLAPMFSLTIAASNADRPVGISTSVMRECEPLVIELMAEYQRWEGLSSLPDPMPAIHERAASLKERQPRGDATYGPDLLALKDDLKTAGSPRVVKDLVEMLDLPEGTLKTRLKVAQRGGRIARPSDTDREE